jgi:hypothetical protein
LYLKVYSKWVRNLNVKKLNEILEVRENMDEFFYNLGIGKISITKTQNSNAIREKKSMHLTSLK